MNVFSLARTFKLSRLTSERSAVLAAFAKAVSTLGSFVTHTSILLASRLRDYLCNLCNKAPLSRALSSASTRRAIVAKLKRLRVKPAHELAVNAFEPHLWPLGACPVGRFSA
jgi:hypothetical protein